VTRISVYPSKPLCGGDFNWWHVSLHKGKMPSKTHYKDYIASSQKRSDSDCARWAMVGECENGHAFAKKLLCGREWCPTCGANKSDYHNRRISRWLPKAQQLQTIGYFVIEWPLSSRHELRTKESLQDMGKRVKGAFQSWGYKRGLRRWHFFGESGTTYNPHINVLVDGRWIPPGELRNFKSYLRQVLDEPQLIINYSYRKTAPEMMHTLRYVTRATFLDQSWDYEIAEAIYGFQNSQSWGTWKAETQWELSMEEKDELNLTQIEKLERGICPRCGEPITWSNPVPLALVEAIGGKYIGAGYYELPPPGDPPKRLPSTQMQGCEDWLFSVKQVAHNIAENKRDEPDYEVVHSPVYLFREYLRGQNIKTSSMQRVALMMKAKLHGKY